MFSSLRKWSFAYSSFNFDCKYFVPWHGETFLNIRRACCQITPLANNGAILSPNDDSYWQTQLYLLHFLIKDMSKPNEDEHLGPQLWPYFFTPLHFVLSQIYGHFHILLQLSLRSRASGASRARFYQGILKKLYISFTQFEYFLRCVSISTHFSADAGLIYGRVIINFDLVLAFLLDKVR